MRRTGGSPSDESCDGQDNDGNGSSDEGTCGDDGLCSNLRTDPVHVGTGAFLTHPSVDVRFAGSEVPITFARRYTSMSAWPDPSDDPTRLGRGWFHTFDERLFAADSRGDATPTSGSSPLIRIHRDGDGVGHRFSCAPPHDPSSSFGCAGLGPMSATLTWDATAGEWVLVGRDGTRTEFAATGALLDKHDAAGTAGWSVQYHASGALAGRIDRIEDHLGRALVFVWDAPVAYEELVQLRELRDSTGAVVASYTHGVTGVHLAGATSAAGSETYEYASMVIDGYTINLPYLTTIRRDGVGVVTVEYDHDQSTRYIGRGKVTRIVAGDGSFAFRHAGAADNLCDTMLRSDGQPFDESRTTMVIDRSTPASPASCASDANCSSGFACESGACRPFTCQEYETPSGGAGVNRAALGEVSGNCGCGGGASYTWVDVQGAPRMRSSTARDGTVTTFDYDGEGRLIERCEGDVDSDGDPSTCDDIDPVTGANRAVWTRFFYDANWPSRVSLERTRSRVYPGNFAETEYVYDSVTGRLRFLRRRGYTRDTADNLNASEEATEYIYDSLGRLAEVLGPANERTVYTYWPAGSGNSSGMLRYEDRYYSATQYLRTTYSSYTTLGLPTMVTDPSATLLEYGYDFGGMRLRTVKVAGQQTSLDYDAAGRLWRVVEPTGRSTRYTYDGQGRLQYEDVFESASLTGYAERLAYTYDSAGHRTGITAQRIDGSGWVVKTTFTWGATYESHGFRATETRGPQSPVTYTYDSAAMGYLQSLTRGDGNLETYVNDDFGRHVQITRHFVTNSFTGTHQLAYANATGSNADVGDDYPTTVTDPGGVQRQYLYDDLGHLVRSTSSYEWGTARWAWSQGRMVEMLRPDGKRTTFTYDPLGRVVFIDNDADNPTLLGQDYGFAYDNGDGAVSCPTAYACSSRRGRLARVSIEYAPGAFWQMYYDYVADGSVGSERWPDGRETVYTYSDGRVIRMYLPARPTDAVRYDYDGVAGNAYDPTEVR